uniref:CRAL-TRIO domain-containing protein n=1 Tax=Timspurckia oligopyrenoides TaxID=708627 RepID=A0A7S1ETQ7_9RHOD|mmetsp:Transcript_6736/g.12039  ORF Transcript_6736/g.12039 Transcript_6736/m.12039 type:complete len:299 (+) Transcript_6736:208-1104(+)
MSVPSDSPDATNIDVLLEKHSASIKSITTIIYASPSVVIPEWWDEIWTLRYILSGRGASDDQVAKRVIEAIEYRSKNPFLHEANPQQQYPADRAEQYQFIKKYLCAGRHGYTRDGGIVQVIRSGISRPAEAVKAVGHDLLAEFYTFNNECMYRALDEITRKTRTLVKCTVLNDMKGMGYGTVDRAFLKCVGASSHVSEILHPQLLARTVVVHPPVFFKMIFGIGKHFMSRSAVERFQMCNVSLREWKDITGHNADQVFDFEQIPWFLGGNCKLHPDIESTLCIPPAGNLQTTPIPLPK